MNHKYLPYNFDFNYEIKTYRNIGKDYGDCNIANRGIISNLRRYCRFKINTDDKYYKKCNNYSEWKEYISCKYQYSCSENFYHYLKKSKKEVDKELEIYKISFIPLIICFITVFFTFITSTQDFSNYTSYYKSICMSISLIGTILSLFFSFKLFNLYERSDFYSDCIEIFYN